MENHVDRPQGLGNHRSTIVRIGIRPQRHYYQPRHYRSYEPLSYYEEPRYIERVDRPHHYADLNHCRRVPLRVIDAHDRVVSIVVWRCEGPVARSERRRVSLVALPPRRP